MIRFIEVKNEDKEKEPSRIAISNITDYRKFKTDDGKSHTIIFFKHGDKKKSKVVDIDVKEIDKIVGVVCIG